MDPALAQKLIITFDPKSGQVQVQGPIDRPFWCMGALEEAKRVIQRRANERAAAAGNGKPPALDGLIVVPPGAIPGIRG